MNDSSSRLSQGEGDPSVEPMCERSPGAQPARANDSARLHAKEVRARGFPSLRRRNAPRSVTCRETAVPRRFVLLDASGWLETSVRS